MEVVWRTWRGGRLEVVRWTWRGGHSAEGEYVLAVLAFVETDHDDVKEARLQDGRRRVAPVPRYDRHAGCRRPFSIVAAPSSAPPGVLGLHATAPGVPATCVVAPRDYGVHLLGRSISDGAVGVASAGEPS